MSNKKEYTTSNGVVVEIKSVPPYLLDQLFQQINYPIKPTYSTVTAGGEKEVFEHDETTLETPEDKAIWAKYQAEQAAAELQENELMMNVMLLKGINVDTENGHYHDWLEEQAFLGIKLPESKPALKVQYIKTEVLANPEDIAQLMTLIMAQSGVSEEVVKSATDSFQSAVSGKISRNDSDKAGKVES